MRKSRNLIALLLLLQYLSLHAQQRFLLPSRERDPNEVSMAISPLKPHHITVGSNIASLYFSHDGGVSWRDTSIDSKWGIWGDPVILAHPNGNFLYAHLSKTKGKPHPHWIDRIVVQSSNDSGMTWSAGEAIGHDGDNAQDKPWMKCDAHRSSPYFGKAYLSWTEFDRYGSENPEHKSRIRFAVLDENGRLQSEIQVVSDIEGNCLDGDQTPEGATPVALPNGRVILVWAFDEKIWMDKSDDGGKTWGTDRVIAQQPGGWKIELDGIYRANNMPFTAWTPLEGNPDGRAWVCFGAYDRSGFSDVLLIYSDDAGETWSQPFVLGDNKGYNCDRFMPYLTSESVSGNLAVVYYDRCFSESNMFMDVSMVYLDFFGFRNFRLTDGSFAPAGSKRFFGDYITAALSGERVFAIWTEHRNGKLQLPGLSFVPKNEKPKIENSPVVAWFRQDEILHYHITTDTFFKGKLVIRWKGGIFSNKTKIKIEMDRADKEGKLVISGKKRNKIVSTILLKM